MQLNEFVLVLQK